jgi:predicted Zn-dependent peptidase
VEAVLAAEIRRLGHEPPAEPELAAARGRYLGALYRRCESNLGLANAVGVEALARPDGPPLAQTLTRAATLTTADVADVARRHFAHAAPAHARLQPVLSRG